MHFFPIYTAEGKGPQAKGIAKQDVFVKIFGIQVDNDIDRCYNSLCMNMG